MTHDERLAWLAERRKGLGATDVYAIAGLGFDNHTPRDVYAEKTGEGGGDNPGTPLMRMGLLTEELNAELYVNKLKCELQSPGLVWSTQYPFAFATFDRVATEDNLWIRPVDLKYTPYFGDNWGEDGSDDIPERYLIQLHWQMIVARNDGRGGEIDYADISALSGSGEHRIYRVAWDEELAEMLIDLGQDFWNRVELRLGIDNWEPPLGIQRRIAQLQADESVQLDQAVAELADEYQAAGEVETNAKRIKDELKERMQAALGSAGCGVLPDGRRLTQKVVKREPYTVKATEYVDFRILNKRKEKGS